MDKTVEFLLVGLVAGVLAGALGMSAATVLVPAMLLLGLMRSYKTAIGTAVMTILPPVMILALMKYYKEGLVDVHGALLLMVGTTLGAGIGAHFTVHHASEALLAHTSAFVYTAAAIAWLYIARSPSVNTK